ESPKDLLIGGVGGSRNPAVVVQETFDRAGVDDIETQDFPPKAHLRGNCERVITRDLPHRLCYPLPPASVGLWVGILPELIETRYKFLVLFSRRFCGFSRAHSIAVPNRCDCLI